MKAFFLCLYLTLLHVIALLLFCNGFLLTRTSLDDISEAAEDTVPNPAFTKAVIFVIDALRFDFTTPQSDNSPYWNRLTILSEYASEYPHNAVLTKFIADPPTTTLQRLKGLTTGSLPTFVDAGSNFAGDAITEDNLLLQLRHAGKRIAFAGDDTWQALFPGTFEPELNFPFESLNVWDLDTVDNGVHHHLFESESAFFRPAQQDSWDIVIVHSLGLDHAGHRYGPSHHEATRKLLQMNDWVAELISAIDDDTLLVIMGDHGMNPQGDHGGDSTLELEAALFMYSKREMFNASVDLSAHNRGVPQIDFVSTFALLMGIPIPFNNLGFPITAAFPFTSSTSLDTAITMTTRQIQRYIETYQRSSSTIKELLAPHNLAFADQRISPIEWQHEVVQIFRQQWAQYHMPSIAYGLLFFFMVIVLELFLYLTRDFSSSMLSCAALLVNTGPLFISLALRGTLAKQMVRLGLVSPVVLHCAFLCATRHSSVQHAKAQVAFNFHNIMGCIVLFLHAAIFASNSFTIHEDRIVLFLLTTLLICKLLTNINPTRKSSRQTHSEKQQTLCCLAVLVLARFASASRLCREEQSDLCTSNFHSLSPWLVYILAFTFALLTSKLLQYAFNSTNNATASSVTWLRCASDCLLQASWIYWLLDYLDRNGLKLSVARIYLFAVCGLTVAWIRLPLPLSFELKSRSVVARGAENKTATTYIQLFLPTISLLIVLSRSAGSISIMMLLIQLVLITCFSGLHSWRKLEWFDAVVLMELAFLHFFATGHQMALPFIQWDMAFFVSKTITYPMAPLFVAANAFAAFILVGLWVPARALWRVPRNLDQQSTNVSAAASNETLSTSPEQVQNTAVMNLMLGIILAVSTLTFSTMVFATHFRRHLMVWKIFAPRFMCAAVILLLIDASCLAASLGISLVNYKSQHLANVLAGGMLPPKERRALYSYI